PALVVGEDPLLLVGDDAALLQPRDDALERVVEVLVHDRLALLAAGGDRSLVADVREVGAGEAGGLAGDSREVDVLDGLAAGLHLENLDAPLEVGRLNQDLAVETAGTKERAVEVLEAVGRAHH